MNDRLSTDERPPHERASFRVAGIAPPSPPSQGGHTMRREQVTIPDTSLRQIGTTPATMPPPALSQIATARVAVAALRSNPRDADALEVLHRVLAASAIALTADGTISPAAWLSLRMLSEEHVVLLAAHADAAKYLT